MVEWGGDRTGRNCALKSRPSRTVSAPTPRSAHTGTRQRRLNASAGPTFISERRLKLTQVAREITRRREALLGRLRKERSTIHRIGAGRSAELMRDFGSSLKIATRFRRGLPVKCAVTESDLVKM